MQWVLYLAQVEVPWKDVAALTGAGAWVAIAFLFISGKICTTASADQRAGEWKELYHHAISRLDRAEERLVDSLRVNEVIARVVTKPKDR